MRNYLIMGIDIITAFIHKYFDNEGVLRYLQTGFKGHSNDAATFRLLRTIEPNVELEFLADTYLTAEKNLLA